MNRPSIAGVSQKMLAWLASTPEPDWSSPSMRTMRPVRVPLASPLSPVPISIGPSVVRMVAATAQSAEPTRASSGNGERRSPCPAVSSETASRRLVLPEPLGPVSTTGSGPTERPRLA